MACQSGFGDVEDRYPAPSGTGDPPRKGSAIIHFEVCRPIFVKANRRAPGMSGRRSISEWPISPTA